MIIVMTNLKHVNTSGTFIDSSGCMGGNQCCSETSKCGDQEGDCDSDSDCMIGSFHSSKCLSETYAPSRLNKILGRKKN